MNNAIAAMAGVITLAIAMPGDAQAQSMSSEEAAQLREEIALLKARIEQLERQQEAGTASLAQAPPAIAAPAVASPPPTIDWKGGPRVTQGDRAFKVKGRIQADANYVPAPHGLDDKAFGFSTEFRRIRLGGEGKLGAGFGYKLELELSDNSVDLVDTFMTYESGRWLLTLGNQNPFQSLDELTGDTSGSFMERAAFTDAFNFERRLGLSAQYRHGPLIAQLGVFSDDAEALSNTSDGPGGGDENNSFSIDGRIVYAPKVGNTQLHFGASAHWRDLGRIAEQPVRYRQRPYVHSINTRLIGTPELEVQTERSHGLEFGAVRGPWHVAAEGHALHSDRIDAPTVHFRGGYSEIGYFLTSGDTRQYEKGIFGAVIPKRSVADGGPGAIQLNLRYDYLDLDSKDVTGGTQSAYLAALIWTPIQYLRFNLNYAYLRYTGAKPLTDGRTAYDLHAFGSRFELDF